MMGNCSDSGRNYGEKRQRRGAITLVEDEVASAH